MSRTLETEKQRLRQLERCQECGSRRLLTDNKAGEVVCTSCGLIIRDLVLDQKPEWRIFTNEDEKAKRRVGPPTSIFRYDKNLATTFQPYKDAYEKPLPSKTRIEMMRLLRWDFRSRVGSSKERNLYKAMSELERLSGRLHVSYAVKENAALVYRKALRAGLIRGRSIMGMISASLYAACRLTKTPRSLKEVAKASVKDVKEISRFYRLILRRLKMRVPVDDPARHVPKIASKSQIDVKTQSKAINILREASVKKAALGKNPSGLVAAALYIAAGGRGGTITQSEIAKAAGVTEVSVRNRYKDLKEILGPRPKEGLKE